MERFSGKGFVKFGECDRINKPEFMIARLERAVLRAEKKQVVLEAYLTDDCPCAYDRDARKIIESSASSDFINEQIFSLQSGKSGSVELCNEDSGIRWASGGLMSIDRNGVASLIYRDSAAPSYPGYFTIPSGLSAGKNEILNPEKAIFREGIEEITYIQDGEILVPDVMKKLSFSKDIVANSLSRYFGKECNYRIKKVKASLEDNLPAKAVVYFNKEKISETRCILGIDPGTAGIDLLKIMYVDADFRSAVPFDTEVYKSKNGSYIPIDREICLVDVQELIESGIVKAECFKGRKNIGTSDKEIKATPVLQSVIDYLKY
ncbi:MAG: hypothetical protein NTV63_00300 [Candidatus Woesearchaeota archaeon]|nr:hypothetical protein [Candidatus Woesearchaeota archaeon]